jgi:dGTPase
MGNPPFGHSGEKAIQTYFTEGKGAYLKEHVSKELWDDITHFEGNANAFRLLAHRFKGRREGGFVMTYTTLASIVKYPVSSSHAGKKGKFGFFHEEKDIYKKIAHELGITSMGEDCYARHPLVYLVEAADDICYEIMDIEDAHKLKILSFEETRTLMLGFVSPERREHIIERASGTTDLNEQVVYFRSCAIGELEKECVRVFVENEEAILNGTFEKSLIHHACPLIHDAYEACMKVAHSRIYRSRDVVDTELAGYKIIYTLMGLFIHAVMNPQHAYSRLLLDRVSSQYEVDSLDTYVRIMAVLDYLSGMTDVFALDLYRKINGESLPMI